jgi:hypothetical protein
MTTESAPASPPAASSDLLSGSAAPQQPAPAPAPAWRPVGMPVTPAAFDAPEAVAARAEIAEKIQDKGFYQMLIAEKERGVSGPASKAWAELHARGWPSPTAPSSVDDAAKQADARTAEQWNSHIAVLKQSFPLQPNQEAEIREGIISTDIQQAAREQKDRLVRDKAFYRRLLDGDISARAEWTKLGIILSMRPVPGYQSPHVKK